MNKRADKRRRRLLLILASGCGLFLLLHVGGQSDWSLMQPLHMGYEAIKNAPLVSLAILGLMISAFQWR